LVADLLYFNHIKTPLFWNQGKKHQVSTTLAKILEVLRVESLKSSSGYIGARAIWGPKSLDRFLILWASEAFGGYFP